MSFGGPEGPEDVLPFLRNVTRGRNVPDERLAEVAEQYHLFGGRSPLNDQCRALADAVRLRLKERGRDLPVFFGARNWHPFVSDTVQTMADEGVGRAAVFVTSAFGTYSGCRQYREDLAAAEAATDEAPALEKLRLFYNHPGFIEPMVDSVAAGLAQLSPTANTRVLFSAHSIPNAMADGCDYQDQLAEAARLIMERIDKRSGAADDRLGPENPGHEIVFQSRSGPPQVPWLEPDINDRIQSLASEGVDALVVVPLGFTSDHMEVMFDLDTQASETAAALGLQMIRVPTVGTDPRYVDMIIDLIEEISDGAVPVAIGNHEPWPSPCPEGHCPPPARRPSGAPARVS